MTFDGEETAAVRGETPYERPLALAAEAALDWLASVPGREIPPRAGIEEIKDALGRALPETGADPAEVIASLAATVEPGLIAMASPRFFGWVIGGTQPVALAADWLVSAWDQNTAMRRVTPGVVAAEELAGEWIVDLLGLPPESEAGFTTGATMANLSCLAAAREDVLAGAGWDVGRRGLAGGPPVRVIVGAERHDTVDLALRLLGLGQPTVVPADEQGRIDVGELRSTLAGGQGPAIVILQAGNIHSGAFDDFASAIGAARSSGAWVHIDGAFGLWAAVSPALSHLTAGMAGADSWATDAHKTLNVPYDCGVAIVARPEALHRAVAVHASYLQEASSATDPNERVPELSRRARGVPAWAALAGGGRSGVVRLVDGLVGAARALAERISRLPGLEVVNDVVYTQLCVAARDDTSTEALARALRDDGTAFAMSSRWRDRVVVRFSVSNWATDEQAVAETVAAVERALERI